MSICCTIGSSNSGGSRGYLWGIQISTCSREMTSVVFLQMGKRTTHIHTESGIRLTPPIERTETANSAVPAAHRHRVGRPEKSFLFP
jgi:hypothetical protein